MQPKPLRVASLFGLALILSLTLSLAMQLELPAATGPYAVGQTVFRWADTSRLEALTEDPTDVREVVAFLWYPAQRGTGARSPYFPGLSSVASALVESGEVEAWEVFGLRFIRSQNLLDAGPVRSDMPYPVLILSPGNGTNIEFYTSLASEIASHGYIVVGLNHPYDVPAVELSTGDIAPYNKDQWLLEPSVHQAYSVERIKVRLSDVLFALDQLELLNSSTDSPFAGIFDLEAVAVAGHSLGGITASEACKADARFRACINFDGLQKGGPFSMEETAIPPEQPFMFITKEAQLHPKLIEQFESTRESYWIVVHGASHESFTDGLSLQPHVLPLSTSADQMMSLIQRYTLAFLVKTLKRQNSSLLSSSVGDQAVSVNIYPSD
jgi:hypothetical protein